MKLLRQQTRKAVGFSGVIPQASAPQSHPGIARVLERVFRKNKPEILDLGPICGHTVVYMADRGARVSVDEFEPPPPIPDKQPGQAEDEIVVEPIRIDQPDGRFDLVFAWEQCDFIEPQRLPQFGAELRRVMANGGCLLLFSRNATGKASGGTLEVPCRYRLVSDALAIREGSDRPVLPRWIHPTREIERALAPMSIEGIHLQRNQIREFFAVNNGK